MTLNISLSQEAGRFCGISSGSLLFAIVPIYDLPLYEGLNY